MRVAVSIISWIKDRLATDRLVRSWAQQGVPLQGFAWQHYLGGAMVFFLGVLAFTGILLSLHYVPTSAGAFPSTELLMTKVPYGWLVRSLHKRSADALVILIGLHLVAVLARRAYRRPRELTWVSGMVLLGIVLAIAFFGGLLPGNNLSYFATYAGIEVVGKVPLVGECFVNFVQGGSEPTSRTVTNFFVFHALALPVVLLGVLAVHLHLIRAHGICEPNEPHQRDPGARARRLPLYPDFFKRLLVSWVILLNGLVVVAMVLPPALGEQADRLMPAPPGIKPEWYFLSLYQLLKVLPARAWGLEGASVALGLVGAVALFFLFFPFIAGTAAPSRRSRVARRAAVALVVLVGSVTAWGYSAGPNRHFDAAPTGTGGAGREAPRAKGLQGGVGGREGAVKPPEAPASETSSTRTEER